MAQLHSFGPWSLMNLQSRCQPELQASQGFTETGQSISKMIHPCEWLICSGFWVSVLPYASLHKVICLSHITNDFPWGGQLKKEQGRSHNDLTFQPWKSHTIICNISHWLHRQTLFHMERTMQQNEYQDIRVIEGPFGGWLQHRTIQGKNQRKIRLPAKSQPPLILQ